jgi:hypothetical protein
MRPLHPPLFVAGVWLFSWGVASAQVPAIDATAGQEDGTVARAWHAMLETRVADEIRMAIVVATMPASATDRPRVPRLRTLDDALGAIVIQAIARSTTFRQLVQDISRTDGIVYVEHGRCGHGVRACLLAVTSTGANRIVRVRIAAKKADWDLMGSVGHELQHAVEVLSNPAITSTAAMNMYYRREGLSLGGVFETAAAVKAGNDVRAEVRSQRRNARAAEGR